MFAQSDGGGTDTDRCFDDSRRCKKKHNLRDEAASLQRKMDHPPPYSGLGDTVISDFKTLTVNTHFEGLLYLFYCETYTFLLGFFYVILNLVAEGNILFQNKYTWKADLSKGLSYLRRISQVCRVIDTY